MRVLDPRLHGDDKYNQIGLCLWIYSIAIDNERHFRIFEEIIVLILLLHEAQKT